MAKKNVVVEITPAGLSPAQSIIVLPPEFVHMVVRRLPVTVREVLTQFPEKVFLAGGFVRDVVVGLDPNDIDLWAENVKVNAKLGDWLDEHGFASVRDTDHAETYNLPQPAPEEELYVPVQRILARVGKPAVILRSFDWSICQAAVYHDGTEWVGVCTVGFVEDIKAQRAVFNPSQNFCVVSSIKRMVRFAGEGYAISDESVADLIGTFVAMLTWRDQEYCRRLCQRVFGVREEYKETIEEARGEFEEAPRAA